MGSPFAGILAATVDVVVRSLFRPEVKQKCPRLVSGREKKNAGKESGEKNIKTLSAIRLLCGRMKIYQVINFHVSISHRRAMQRE
jgi:hypothetical protein